MRLSKYFALVLAVASLSCEKRDEVRPDTPTAAPSATAPATPPGTQPAGLHRFVARDPATTPVSVQLSATDTEYTIRVSNTSDLPMELEDTLTPRSVLN